MDKHIEEKPACSVNKALVPEELPCPQCGVVLEAWSDEPEVNCGKCGAVVRNTSYVQAE